MPYASAPQGRPWRLPPVLFELSGRNRIAHPAQISLDSATRQVRNENYLRRCLTMARNSSSMSRSLSRPWANASSPPSAVPSASIELVDVRGDTDAVLVRLVDDGAVKLGRELLYLLSDRRPRS